MSVNTKCESQAEKVSSEEGRIADRQSRTIVGTVWNCSRTVAVCTVAVRALSGSFMLFAVMLGHSIFCCVSPSGFGLRTVVDVSCVVNSCQMPVFLLHFAYQGWAVFS